MRKKDNIKADTGKATERIRNHKSVFLVYLVLRLIVIGVMIRSIMNKEWESVFICLLVLFIYLLPSIFERRFNIELPSLLEIIILLHVFAAEILGELQCYFVQYAHWDTLLHTTWGFLCAAIGFSLVSILNQNKRIAFELSPLYLALTAFCFSMTVGVIWEFFEFFADVLLRTDMQKDTILNSISSVALDPTNSNKAIIINGITSVAVNGTELNLGGYLDIGLYDTMEDLLVNFVGAVFFSVIGYIDAKHHGKSRLAAAFIPYPRGLDRGQPGIPQSGSVHVAHGSEPTDSSEVAESSGLSGQDGGADK